MDTDRITNKISKLNKKMKYFSNSKKNLIKEIQEQNITLNSFQKEYRQANETSNKLRSYMLSNSLNILQANSYLISMESLSKNDEELDLIKKKIGICMQKLNRKIKETREMNNKLKKTGELKLKTSKALLKSNFLKQEKLNTELFFQKLYAKREC